VLANDSDPNGDALNVTNVGVPAHGTAVLRGGQIDYTPAVGYSGLDTFSYTISDGALSSTATVRVIVGGKSVYAPVVRR
jgi:Bacterial Ig domain